jgi:hypothetical protein
MGISKVSWNLLKLIGLRLYFAKIILSHSQAGLESGNSVPFQSKAINLIIGLVVS